MESSSLSPTKSSSVVSTFAFLPGRPRLASGFAFAVVFLAAVFLAGAFAATASPAVSSAAADLAAVFRVVFLRGFLQQL